VRPGRQHVAFLVAMVVMTATSFATTCIAGKKLKIRQVCGQVRDAGGAEIPNAKVQVTRQGQGGIVAEAQTAADGTFALPGIASGDYEIRITFAGFWDASQDFQLTRLAKGAGCSHPIRVVMKPAGSCSYVENAWKK
jgi:hypothetical protein